MFFHYAQTNHADIVVSVSQLSGEVVADNMIPITQAEYLQGTILGMRYIRNTGQWEYVIQSGDGPTDLPVAEL